MDPRIKSRRIDVMRARGRKRLRVLLLIVSLVSLVVGAYLASQSAFLDVDEVLVIGVSGSQAGEVLDVAGIPKGKPLLEVSGSSSANRIEGIPWIDEARVSRSLGGSVTIKVSTRKPVAAFEREGRWLLVDIEGRVLEEVQLLPYGLLPIIAENIDVPVGKWVPEQAIPSIEVAAGISLELVADVSYIKGDTSLELFLFGGGKILFGDTNDLETKVLAAATLLSQVDQSSVLHVDVRAPLTPVLCRDPSCSYPST